MADGSLKRTEIFI